MNITIDQPGIHYFSCQYPNSKKYPQIVLAVGPNMIYEFINMAVKPMASFLCGVYLFVGACGISILIMCIIAFKRHQTKKSLPSQT